MDVEGISRGEQAMKGREVFH